MEVVITKKKLGDFKPPKISNNYFSFSKQHKAHWDYHV